MFGMSDNPPQKPVVKWTTLIDIESDTHGSFRFRKWMLKDSTGIQHLCNEQLEPREFAERLLAQQSVEPLLTQDELKGWAVTELTRVAVRWWQAVEDRRPSPISVDSLEHLQTAVRLRNDEHTESIKSLSVGMSNFNVRMPELNTFDNLARDLAKQSSLLDFAGQSSIQKTLELANLAQP